MRILTLLLAIKLWGISALMGQQPQISVALIESKFGEEYAKILSESDVKRSKLKQAFSNVLRKQIKSALESGQWDDSEEMLHAKKDVELNEFFSYTQQDKVPEKLRPLLQKYEEERQKIESSMNEEVVKLKEKYSRISGNYLQRISSDDKVSDEKKLISNFLSFLGVGGTDTDKSVPPQDFKKGAIALQVFRLREGDKDQLLDLDKHSTDYAEKVEKFKSLEQILPLSVMDKKKTVKSIDINELNKDDQWVVCVYFGTIYIPERGSYEFSMEVESDDEARMFLDFEPFMQTVSFGNEAVSLTKSKFLDAGWHYLRLEYLHTTGKQKFIFKMGETGTELVPVLPENMAYTL